MDSMIGGMKLIDNVNQTLRDDLSEEIKAGSKLSITAAAEQDGIGMNNDSEWVYLEIRDKIKDYIEKNNLQL